MRAIRRFWLDDGDGRISWLAPVSRARLSNQRYRRALRLWLQWDAEFQRSTEGLFHCRHNPVEQRELLDRLERMHHEARAASLSLLSE